ncbi:Rne/Rng family ribonuclease [Ferrimicrobium sp.]|uniref:Rne/Rng family ribonuclease n=1 Tax=Ferrimicrobium sp. TaxID=2926050 RepID=UPI00262087F8|nr:Rne/Rng family ribonuclease [Ferrimicrobium sp.]
MEETNPVGSGTDGAANESKPAQSQRSTNRRSNSRARQPVKSGDVTSANPPRRTQSRRRPAKPQAPVEMEIQGQVAETIDAGAKIKRRFAQRAPRERHGRPVGRYQMVVHVAGDVTQVAILEGRTLIQHFVSRASDSQSNISGNIYLGRVANVLPGMEAAFVDIGTNKNAVLYRGDVRYDREDLESFDRNVRIEQLLRPKQVVVCQVVKNPIAQKGARLTQEVSLPGRFAVLLPGGGSFGISKRLPDDERRRLRRILDDVAPEGFGVILRTAAEGSTKEELKRDVDSLMESWKKIEEMTKSAHAPALLYREPPSAVRVIREEFNREFRGVTIDDLNLYQEIAGYVAAISPELADRVEYFNPETEKLAIFDQFHVREQLQKVLEHKVWLPSGGSIVIDRTEALTVIDVNTSRNVGTVSLEETIHKNNLEAVEEIARQLRLRDIGGIIVIDFVDMIEAQNREDVMRAFRAALTRDKTKTHVYEMSQLGLVQMTRHRIAEGLVEALSEVCPSCGGSGYVIDPMITQ